MQRVRDELISDKFFDLKLLVFAIVVFIPSLVHLWNSENHLVSNVQYYGDNCTFERVEKPVRDSVWYENAPMPPVAVATSRTLPEGACGRQLTRYIQELKEGTLWAAQMFDASVKYPHGVLDGYTRHLGSFDQCYRINALLFPKYNEYDEVEPLKGKYCLVDFEYQKNDLPEPLSGKLSLEFDPNTSVWEAIREKGDFRRIRRYLIQTALCVPAACNSEDVKESLQSSYEDFGNNHDLAITVDVDEKNCQTRDETPRFTRGAILYSLVLFIIITLVMAGTYYDNTLSLKTQRSKSEEILLCFSAWQSIKTISQVNYNHRGLDTIHMFRFLATCLVVFGHRGLQYFYNPIVNAHSFEKTFDVPGFIMIHNGPILVDGFFGIGGLVASYTLLDHLEKTKKTVNFLKLVLLRFMRLTPVYAFVIFFIAYILPHLGSGPLWPDIIFNEAENCASSWWANLLYINNYVAVNRICMFQSWYLAVDFQSYILTIFLVYEFWKRPRKIGYSILIVPTLISILIPFFLTYSQRIQPLFIPFPFLTKLEMDPYFWNYYIKTHIRLSAYLIGVIFGAVLFDYRKSSWRISKKHSKKLFVLMVIMTCYGAQGLGYKYLNPNSKPSLLYTALYASLPRGAYAAGVCSIVFLITVCDGLDSHHKFMTKKWAQPLARLTYSVILSHTILQSYQMATNRGPRTFSTRNVVWDILPDIVFSFSFAFLIVVLIEAPFRKMEKLFISR